MHISGQPEVNELKRGFKFEELFWQQGMLLISFGIESMIGPMDSLLGRFQ